MSRRFKPDKKRKMFTIEDQLKAIYTKNNQYFANHPQEETPKQTPALSTNSFASPPSMPSSFQPSDKTIPQSQHYNSQGFSNIDELPSIVENLVDSAFKRLYDNYFGNFVIPKYELDQHLKIEVEDLVAKTFDRLCEERGFITGKPVINMDKHVQDEVEKFIEATLTRLREARGLDLAIPKHEIIERIERELKGIVRTTFFDLYREHGLNITEGKSIIDEHIKKTFFDLYREHGINLTEGKSIIDEHIKATIDRFCRERGIHIDITADEIDEHVEKSIDSYLLVRGLNKHMNPTEEFEKLVHSAFHKLATAGRFTLPEETIVKIVENTCNRLWEERNLNSSQSGKNEASEDIVKIVENTCNRLWEERNLNSIQSGKDGSSQNISIPPEPSKIAMERDEKPNDGNAQNIEENNAKEVPTSVQENIHPIEVPSSTTEEVPPTFTPRINRRPPILPDLYEKLDVDYKDIATITEFLPPTKIAWSSISNKQVLYEKIKLFQDAYNNLVAPYGILFVVNRGRMFKEAANLLLFYSYPSDIVSSSFEEYVKSLVACAKIAKENAAKYRLKCPLCRDEIENSAVNVPLGTIDPLAVEVQEFIPYTPPAEDVIIPLDMRYVLFNPTLEEYVHPVGCVPDYVNCTLRREKEIAEATGKKWDFREGLIR